jgi:hypothetical protein
MDARDKTAARYKKEREEEMKKGYRKFDPPLSPTRSYGDSESSMDTPHDYFASKQASSPSSRSTLSEQSTIYSEPGHVLISTADEYRTGIERSRPNFILNREEDRVTRHGHSKSAIAKTFVASQETGPRPSTMPLDGNVVHIAANAQMGMGSGHGPKSAPFQSIPGRNIYQHKAVSSSSSSSTSSSSSSSSPPTSSSSTGFPPYGPMTFAHRRAYEKKKEAWKQAQWQGHVDYRRQQKLEGSNTKGDAPDWRQEAQDEEDIAGAARMAEAKMRMLTVGGNVGPTIDLTKTDSSEEDEPRPSTSRQRRSVDNFGEFVRKYWPMYPLEDFTIFDTRTNRSK